MQSHLRSSLLAALPLALVIGVTSRPQAPNLVTPPQDSELGACDARSKLPTWVRWQKRPYSAVSYTADTGRWTVAARDIAVDDFAFVGDTLFVCTDIRASALSTQTTRLTIGLPPNFVAAETVQVPNVNAVDSGGQGPALVDVTAGSRTLVVSRLPGGSFRAGNLSVRFELFFKVSRNAMSPPARQGGTGSKMPVEAGTDESSTAHPR